MGQIAKTSKFRNLAEAEEVLESLVTQVNRGMEQFAVTIKEIKDSKLYLQAPGSPSFATYCSARWGRTVRTVQRALNAHETRTKLLTDAKPSQRKAIRDKTTRQINEIAKLPKEQQLGAATSKERIDFYSSPNPAPRRETEEQIVARRLRDFSESQPEEHREYILWIANNFHRQ